MNNYQPVIIQRSQASIQLPGNGPQRVEFVPAHPGICRTTAQGVENNPSDLSVRSLEALTRPCRTITQTGLTGRIESAQSSQRAALAQRLSSRTDQGAQLHHGLVPQHGLTRVIGQHRVGQTALLHR